jgi:carbamoyl-phosphate synthase large subunit
VDAVSAARRALDVRPVFKRIDTCAGEFPSNTPYMYSCYEGDGVSPADCESEPTDRKKVIILGGGPNRIGQGIEFDYCCVHAAFALEDAGYETIMVNCNPETVSTDYDTSDRLYFEPLTGEDVVELITKEQTNGEVLGAIVQFGGQTPLKLARALEKANIPILGTSPDAIDLAEDRELFQQLLHKLALKQPPNAIAASVDAIRSSATELGYPLVIRPSFVLGGRAMEIVHDDAGLNSWINRMVVEQARGHAAIEISEDMPVLLDKYLAGAVEIDLDALRDTTGAVFVAGVMQHIEEAGVHSGDSACSLPPYSLTHATIEELKRQAALLAEGLNVVGLMNVQFAVKDNEVFILEVNPRASRTVPFVAKATGNQIAKIAARVMAGEPLSNFALKSATPEGHVAVKEAVFPFARFPGVDIVLGPEMKSTGEVMGIDKDFECAFAKSQLGAGTTLPMDGTVFLSVREGDKIAALAVAKDLVAMGFKVIATKGTASFFAEHGVEVKSVNKVLEGRPHCVDAMLDGEVHMVVNTTEGAQALKDSIDIRRTALMNNIPHYTTMPGARAATKAIEALKRGALEVTPLQHYSL